MFFIPEHGFTVIATTARDCELASKLLKEFEGLGHRVRLVVFWNKQGDSSLDLCPIQHRYVEPFLPEEVAQTLYVTTREDPVILTTNLYELYEMGSKNGPVYVLNSFVSVIAERQVRKALPKDMIMWFQVFSPRYEYPEALKERASLFAQPESDC